MGKAFTTAMLATGLLLGAPAGAAVIDFDDLVGDGTAIENGYGGLQWENFHALDPFVDMPVSGYNFAITSGRNIAYSGSDLLATIGGLGGMMLDFGHFTAAFNDGLTISARGYDGDRLVHQKDFVVTTTDPTRIDFGWRGISRVVFSSEGGVDQLFDMSGTNFAIDDLGVSAVGAAGVPEPGTWLTMLVGFAVVGGVMRRRRSSVTTRVGWSGHAGASKR